MTLKIHKQSLAEKDLKNIWLYSFKHWAEEQADLYFDELADAITLLAENPKLGVTCDYIREGYRQFHINRHLLFYRTTPGKLHIVRVLGEEMDINQHF